MSPSYQTIPPANAPKDEPSSTLVPMMKKVAVAAMVGTALVVGYSYGSSTNPAMIKSVTNSFAKMEEEKGGPECYRGPCDKNRNEKDCKEAWERCYWYPHIGSGMCSSCSGVSCGEHRNVRCARCNFYGPKPSNPFKTSNKGKNYCNGECEWKRGLGGGVCGTGTAIINTATSSFGGAGHVYDDGHDSDE